jgi:hypothetical protein
LFVEDRLEVFGERLTNVLLGHFRARDLSRVVAVCELSPVQLGDYVDESHIPAVWLALRQVSSFFTKNEAFGGPHTEAAALESFREYEAKCEATNLRLDVFADHDDPRTVPVWGEVIAKMQRDIAGLLGSLEQTFLPGLLARIRLTSGATEDRSRKRALPFLKVSGKLRAPKAARRHVESILPAMGVEPNACQYISTERNRVEFVLKNWRTKRGIACEPTHALPFQLAFGEFIAERLPRWGITLRDQSRNQEAALQGSLTGEIATLDLRGASDCMAYNAVCLLLPYEWYRFAADIRSSEYILPNGEQGTYAKFSSMGNGFTFPLESMIFGAACRALGASYYRVYGDDIAVDVATAPKVVELLEYLGFSLNAEKSFASTDFRFRESCGADYYEGHLVTPWKMRSAGEVDKSTLCHFVNAFLALSWPGGKLWDYAISVISDAKLPLVPYNTDTRSGVFKSPWDAHRLGVIKSTRTDEKGENPYLLRYRANVPTPGKPRVTRGWRSSFLWHLSHGSKGAFDYPVPFHPALGRGTSKPSLALECIRALVRGDPVSEVTSDVRYLHGWRTYVPVQGLTPLHLYHVV